MKEDFQYLKIKFDGGNFCYVRVKQVYHSVEVFRYPYFGKSIESEEGLSEKICCSTIKVRKKIIKKAE